MYVCKKVLTNSNFTYLTNKNKIKTLAGHVYPSLQAGMQTRHTKTENATVHCHCLRTVCCRIKTLKPVVNSFITSHLQNVTHASKSTSSVPHYFRQNQYMCMYICIGVFHYQSDFFHCGQARLRRPQTVYLLHLTCNTVFHLYMFLFILFNCSVKLKFR